jgi:uncharacterized membrane protein YfcA
VWILTPLEFVIAAFVLAVTAGALGALLGLGGGVIIVPALTVVLGVDIRYAIGASIVAMIATSSGSTVRYMREGLVNIRIALFLELATVVGALVGAYLAGVISHRTLYFVFAALAVAIGALMLRSRHEESVPTPRPALVSRSLGLGGTVVESAGQAPVDYEATRTPLGLGMSFLAGSVSGLLGVGGGVLKVPAMNVAMGVPIKVATATSSFMIGVTAAASAGVFFHRGDIAPCVTAPVVIGVLAGTLLGTRLHRTIPASGLRIAFVVVLGWSAVSMFVKGLTQ